MGGNFINTKHNALIKNTVHKSIIPIIIFLLITALFTTILISLNRKTISVNVDGQHIQFVTNRSTVEEALNEQNIELGPKDKTQPTLDTSLKNHDIITIKRAVNVTIDLYGKKLVVQSAENDIKSMLTSEEIVLNPTDKINPGMETLLYDGIHIDIINVEKKTVIESVPLKYNTIVKKDRSLANTKKKTVQEGKAGEKQISMNVVYENNKEVSRKVIEEKVIKSPVDEIITQGTYPVKPVSESGEALAYSRKFTAKATAYWAIRGVGKTYTASGRKAVYNPDGYSTIAVDPKVIPYGTKLFVEGYGFAIAADTGTSIKGDTVDVYFNTYKEACNWGLKYVDVYVLK
ncbi:3D domain-containing protein [Petroclostridium sp. X23]|uniref:3D domain-containing protein n=1 Tax=Petroclostridium sp. X23 TaxID=3045146 RepID=UPI0024AD5980|nr:3D domain-containing protein [Petroclostridium sp. X23]WHH57298.1 ubiquitin-like domain-containing protein [Petroclostridium sp. X23]